MDNLPGSESLQARDGALHTVIPSIRQAQRVTGGREHEQLLYFTSTSISDDGVSLVVIVSSEGKYDLAVYDLQTGQRRMLTDHEPGFLKSYVYFDGEPYRGFARASVSFDPAANKLYYIHGRQIRALRLSGGPHRMLAELPGDQVTAFTHVSGDGAQLCVPTTDDRALADDVLRSKSLALEIDATVQRENLRSFLNVYATSTGQRLESEIVERAWITHVQFRPGSNGEIAYNHEWPSDCGIRRVWVWDREAAVHSRMRPEGDGRSREDWACHEMWERDGSRLIYHGGYRDGGPCYLGRVDIGGGGLVEIALPDTYTPYGHFTTGRPGWLVADGYFVGSGGNAPGNWISLAHVDWEARTVKWYPLCASRSSWNSQDAHPHPIFDSAGQAVYFTADPEGNRAVYRVDVSDIVTDDN